MPEEFQEFSDDEKESERKLKRRAGLKGNSRKRNSLERHRNFVHKMNKRNTLDTVSQIAMGHHHHHQGGPSTTTSTVIPPPQCYQFVAPPPPLAVPAFDPTRLPPPPPPPAEYGYYTFPPTALWSYGHPQPPGS